MVPGEVVVGEEGEQTTSLEAWTIAVIDPHTSGLESKREVIYSHLATVCDAVAMPSSWYWLCLHSRFLVADEPSYLYCVMLYFW